MTLALIIIGLSMIVIWILMLIINEDNAGLLLIPICLLALLVAIVPTTYYHDINKVKHDFLEGKYVKQYTYIDSIKVDSTYVLKEDIFKHK
jgi:hypothetical protein